ncbi:hypothetical protein [Mucilaginibacter sp.]|uniref:hypothetical protein n=1 Tax=Mucilaginibacter sp. TaxID=1882438 RepID=UPI0032641F62
MKNLYYIILLLSVALSACKKNGSSEPPSNTPKKYTITAGTSGNGSVTPAGTKTVNAGSNEMYFMTPAANYGVASIAVDFKSVPLADSYTFTNVQANHTINVEFAPLIKLTDVSATPNVGGSVSYSPTSIVSGQTVTFTFSPKPNYITDNLYIDGKLVKALNGETTYTLANDISDHTFAVSFSLTTKGVDSLKNLLIGKWILTSHQSKLGKANESFFRWETTPGSSCSPLQYEEFFANGVYTNNGDGSYCSPLSREQFKTRSPNHWELKKTGTAIYLTDAPKDSLINVTITKDSLLADYESPAPSSGRISYRYHYAKVKDLPSAEYATLKAKLIGTYASPKDANGNFILDMYRFGQSLSDLTSGWVSWTDEPICQLDGTFSMLADGTYKDFAGVTSPCSPYTSGQQASHGTWTLSSDGRSFSVFVDGRTTVCYIINVSNTSITYAFNTGNYDVRAVAVKK